MSNLTVGKIVNNSLTLVLNSKDGEGVDDGDVLISDVAETVRGLSYRIHKVPHSQGTMTVATRRFFADVIHDDFFERDVDRTLTLPLFVTGRNIETKLNSKAIKKTLFFENKKVIDDPDVCRGDEVRAIIKVNYVWTNKNKFGVTLMAKQFEYRKTDDEECSLSD